MNQLITLVLVLPLSLLSGSPGTPSAQTYNSSREDVRKALQVLGAFEDASLPMLEGFVVLDPEQIKAYDGPRYQFRVEFKEAAAGQTVVSLEARISARYMDGASPRSDYRSVTSNGRLEADMLERLRSYLDKKTGTTARGAPALQEQITNIRSQATAAEQRRLELEKKISEMSNFAALRAPALNFVPVAAGGAAVLERPADSARVIFQAEVDDELEVTAERGEWVQVRIGNHSTGWIRRTRLSQRKDKSTEARDHFIISREDQKTFSGEWAELHGKQALFVWAQQARDTGMTATSLDVWNYAKRVFLDTYRTVTHLPPNAGGAISGVVVVFTAPQPAVAEATLTDIGQWLQGKLSEAAFTKRCLLDPDEAFRDARKPILSGAMESVRTGRRGD